MKEIVFIPGRNRACRWGGDFFLEYAILNLEDSNFDIQPAYFPKSKTLRRKTIQSFTFKNADLIHIHNLASCFKGKMNFLKMALFKIRNRGIPVLGGVRGEPGFQSMKRGLRLFDFIHTSNENLKNKVSKINSNVYVLYPGVDTRRFRPKTKPDKFILGWAGGNNKEVKNFDMVESLDCKLRTATRDNYIPHWKMPDFYNSCSALILLSKSEGCNRTVLEAMSCGLPVISTDTGTVRKQLDEKWIIPMETNNKRFLDVVSAKINKLAKNKSLREEVGRRNRKEALKWDWKSSISRLERLWENVI